MLEVRTLGGLAVERDGAVCDGAAGRRKTLALLALLAAAGKRGMSREKLVAYLWPDSDTGSGRHLLKQACYALRRDLGQPDLFLSSATELRLNPATISSDIQRVEDALQIGDLAGVVKCYTGPFLDGFYLDGSGEFERWAERERARIADRVAKAVERLATEAAANGDHRAAAEWWRRGSELDPLNSQIALCLMNALAVAGDPAGALHFARVHERLLHEELDTGPEAAVVELAARLRAASGGRTAAPSYSHGDGARYLGAEVIAAAAPRVARRRLTLVGAKLAAGLVAVTVVGAALVWRSRSHVPLDSNLIAVAPFDVLPPDMKPWQEGLVNVLSGYLDGAGPLRTVAPTVVMRQWRGPADPVAAAALGQRTGARFVLFGALLGAGPDSVRLTATLLDVASGKTLAATAYRDATNHVDRLSDSLVVAVLHELGRSRPAGAIVLGGRDGARTVSVNVLGPDGRRSICDYLPAGAVVTARLLNTTPPPLQGGFDAFACPEFQLQLSAPTPGIWHLRVDLPHTPALGALPPKHFETAAVEFGVARDIVIREGSALGGRATFERKPVGGVGLTISYELTGLNATFGTSGPDGEWVDFLGRVPVLLQTDVRYVLSPSCMYLGAKLVSTPPRAGFLFPSQARSVDCALVTAPSVRFTHDLTRLVVTPMPGDIGGLSDEFAHEFGYGWGVQFPVAAGQSPAHEPAASHLFQGGLLIGIAPDRVISGVSMKGQAACGASCRDLGLDAQVSFAAWPRFGKTVIWRYSDAGSPEGVGLRVLQQSFDGRPPADYVLFRFTITNSGPSATTFHAGFFGDWDIGADADDDVGFTDMAGRLMYQTNADGTGPYVGTLLSSDAPTTGNFFFRKVTVPSLTEQVDALAGRISQPRSDAAGDNRYVHGAGPFTLASDQSVELWIAVVAGETRDQLRANAAAAAADAANRSRQPPAQRRNEPR